MQTRRQFVHISLGGVSTLFVGCGGVEPPRPKNRTPRVNTQPTEVSLTFSESDEFYGQLTGAINRNQDVILRFDGQHLVAKESRLIKEFVQKATNCEVLYKAVSAKEETEKGREELKRVFHADLLKHEPIQKEVTLPSNEVIEPATVILVLGIILILAAASVAHAESYRRRNYEIEIIGTPNGMGLKLKCRN